MKKYWARLSPPFSAGYGDWVPTGATTLEEAIDYIHNYYEGRWVREWLLL